MRETGTDRARPAAAEGSPDAVLVVDDEKLVRRSVAACLEDAGHRAIEAAGGPEALAILDTAEGRSVGLVLLDMRMPGMDGLEVFRRIRERRPALRVAFLTAQGERDLRSEASRLAAYDFLEKPPSIEALAALARHALETARLEWELGRLRADLAAVAAARTAATDGAPEIGTPGTAGDPFSHPRLTQARQAFEKLFLLKRLVENGGSVARTARAVGMDRTSLYRKLRAFGVGPSEIEAMRKGTSTRGPSEGSV